MRTLWSSLLIVFLGTLLAGQARGQIFVANSGSGTIGEYDYNNGGTMQPSLVSGLSSPWGIAVSGANLLVANNTAGTIGKYNVTTGATVNASLVSGLSSPRGVAVSGGYLYVANYKSGTIGEYNATTGATVNASLVSGLNGPTGIAVSGGYLYVANYKSGTIGEYNATTGATVNASLVSGLNHPTGIAVTGGYLYVANYNSGTIGEYNATTGATVNASLVSGLRRPAGIAVPGANLFVANSGTGTIGEYNATTGATVKASLVSGLSGPAGIALSGANLFVVNQSTSTIGEYNTTTGAAVNASLVSGLSGPGIAVVATLPQFNLLKVLPLQSNAYGSVTVNEALNKIYTSGNPSSVIDIEVEVIDGVTFATKDVGYGNGANVDNKTNRYWAASIFYESVIVRDGATNSVVATVPIPDGYCPLATTYDFSKSRVWVGCQCGGGNDPVFAIDANTFKITAGPIGSGGILGTGYLGIIANGANGRLYLYDPISGSSERVNPTTFAVTKNDFGTVRAINALTNTLYAVDSANNLQIMNGVPDPEIILATVPLSYTPESMGINTALNHLYIANPAGNSIEVRNPSTGALITMFALSAFSVTPNGAMAVDSTRSRIYVIDQSSSPPVLLVIEDLITAAKPNGVP